MGFLKDTQEKYIFLLDEYKKQTMNDEIEKLSEAAIGKMINDGTIVEPLDVLEKLSEFRQQDIEELKILNKAIEFGKVNSTHITKEASLGSLAEKSTSVENAEERFISFLTEDLY